LAVDATAPVPELVDRAQAWLRQAP
jgi:hypothetical protein